jgi:hypothetical protein
MAQFVDILKTSFRGPHGITVRKMILVFWTTFIIYSGDMMLLHLILFMSHSRETPDNVRGNRNVAEQIRQAMSAAVCAGNMKIFSVACVSGYFAKKLLHLVSSDAWEACLTSQSMLLAFAFMYFKECNDTKQSLTHRSEKLVETASSCITPLEKIMAKVAHLSCIKEHITASIKKSVEFDWIRSTVVHFTTKD